jgi:lipopolysaccharide heptosyltransferase I
MTQSAVPSRVPFLGEPPPKRVLIVRPTALGDVARTVPVLATLREALPEARIDWLVAKAFADAVRHHPMLDNVVEFDRKELSRFGLSPSATRAGFRFAKLLRENQYDAVYDLQGLFRSGLFTRLSGARRRVGFANAREFAWLGYNARHRIDPTLHTVDRMLALLAADGLEPIHDMRLHLADADAQWLAEFKQDHHIADAGYACIAPTARWGCKCWPIERFGQVARRMLDQGLAGDKLILLASPDERDRVLPIFETLIGDGPAGSASGGASGGGDLRDRVVFPTTSVGQMMALLSETRVLVCNDSAPLHIAVGFNRPVVAIFGPTDPATVGPYRRHTSVLRPPEAELIKANYRKHMDDPTLISKITVDQVWQKLLDQMNGDLGS